MSLHCGTELSSVDAHQRKSSMRIRAVSRWALGQGGLWGWKFREEVSRRAETHRESHGHWDDLSLFQKNAQKSEDSE